jgi:SAM-dependent methyltransferase
MHEAQLGQVDALNQEVRNSWNQNALFWDERMGEGNSFHKTLIEPTQERLLNVCAGQRILDIACGNGQFARRLAKLGTCVLGVDISERMIVRARARTIDPGNRIGQPVPQYYFHRPMSLLLNPAFEAGFVLDGLAEPVFAPPSEGQGSLFEHVYSDIPPAFVARLRLPP